MDDCIEFECDQRMVAVARAFVADRLSVWEVDQGVDEALLVVSELVSNAVVHARTAVRVRVQYDGVAVRLEVRDENSRLPALAPCPLDATSGRGLMLIGSLSSSWGIEHFGEGKVIWAEIRGDRADGAAQGRISAGAAAASS
ncbi:MAG TPA: ATP-binding protein [Acidimicrobiales bacterium]|nr:ATP-binding protein [Acidimicrobiales bacterium]